MKFMVCDKCGAKVPLVEDAADVDGLHGKCGCGGCFTLLDGPFEPETNENEAPK